MVDESLELLKRARRGDEEALSSLLAEVEPMIYRFGLKLCRNPEDAKGVLQETMISLIQSVDSFRGDSSLSTWLYSVARSHCAKKRRKSVYAPKRLETLDTPASAVVPAEGSDPLEALSRRLEEAELDQAIRKLDEKYRDVLVLRDIAGLTAPDVAEVMGLSVSAVKSRLHRARADLRELLLGPIPPGGESCPDVANLLSRNLEGDLSAKVCQEMQEHVTTCTHCKSVCDSLRGTLAACSATRTPKIPADLERSVRAAIREVLEG